MANIEQLTKELEALLSKCENSKEKKVSGMGEFDTKESYTCKCEPSESKCSCKKESTPSTIEDLIKKVEEIVKKEEAKKESPYIGEYITCVNGDILYMGKVNSVTKTEQGVEFNVSGYVQSIKDSKNDDVIIRTIFIRHEGSFMQTDDVKIISETQYIEYLAVLTAAFINRVYKTK